MTVLLVMQRLNLGKSMTIFHGSPLSFLLAVWTVFVSSLRPEQVVFTLEGHHDTRLH